MCEGEKQRVDQKEEEYEAEEPSSKKEPLRLRRFLPPGFPVIVVLCGSTRFTKEWEEANERETLDGKVVLSVGLLGHQKGLDMNGPVKKMLDELHFFKIELADEVFVINPKAPWCKECNSSIFSVQDSPCFHPATSYELRPYIGESTRKEIEHAKKLYKTLRFLNEMSV